MGKNFSYGQYLLNKIAQVIEDNLEYLATVETIDNGKAIRETMAADIPVTILGILLVSFVQKKVLLQN
jgi:acyl-CoA reductase-like NAD-dependent aldehyde dehydrogenase